jgi:lipoate-protein ligase A
MRQWRLIYDSPAAGSHNMAVDQAILEAVAKGESLPTLRLYAWEPPCLSLGYGQRAGDVDFARTAAYGWEVVRRPTGGRAILHTDELTYSLCLPEGDELAAGSVVESYQRISTALLAGLREFDAEPQADAQAERAPVGPVCFETPSHYEITVDGRKLVGSAQARRGGGVLQHGSLPLYGDLGRICDGLVYPNEAAREAGKAAVRARAITLGEALGWPVTVEEAAEAIVDGFAEAFGVQFQFASLTRNEVARAEQLAGELYGSEAWTRRRA